MLCNQRPELIFHVVDRIKQVPLSKLGKEIFSLITGLSKLASQDIDAGCAIIDLLWSLCEDDTESQEPRLSEELVNIAKIRIVEALRMFRLKNKRIQFVSQCVDQIAAHKSVPQSLTLLVQVLQTFPQYYSQVDEFNLASMIAHLIRTKDLLCIILDDFLHFKKQARQLFEEKSVKPDDADKFIVFSRTTFISHINERLNALNYIVSNSNLTLSVEQTDNLWRELYTNALSHQEKDSLLRWLTSALTSVRGQFVFADDIICHIFSTHLTQLYSDWSETSFVEFSTFKSYFLRVNEIEGNLSFHDPSISLRSLPSKLNGVDALWSIALESENEDVVAGGVDLLYKVHQNLSPEISDQEVDIRTGFMVRCIDQLEIGRRTNSKKLVLRCLLLLEMLLDASEAQGGIVLK